MLEPACEALRVLVAEDNSVNQFVVKNMLRKLGVNQVQFAGNGKDALDMLAAEDFDIVLMNCNMPVMDGLEATRLIRQKEARSQSKRIPIAALTASATPEEQAQCLAAEMDIHICKPLILSDLATALYELYKKVGRTRDSRKMILRAAFEMIIHQRHQFNTFANSVTYFEVNRLDSPLERCT